VANGVSFAVSNWSKGCSVHRWNALPGRNVHQPGKCDNDAKLCGTAIWVKVGEKCPTAAPLESCPPVRRLESRPCIESG
jgi:hypothetical protein